MKTSKLNDTHYLLPDTITKTFFLDSLAENFTVKVAKATQEKITILDSFEWGIYKKNKLAIRHEDHAVRVYDENELFVRDLAFSVDKVPARTKFWWEFPESEVRDFMTTTLGLRALIPVFNGSLRYEQVNLQDDQGKTLVFCELISVFSDDKTRTPLVRQVSLAPITGYQEYYEQALGIITNIGAFTPTLSPLNSLLQAIGVSPNPYNVKPELSLSAHATARSSVSSIITTMLEKQRLTENGVIKDIDTEFLHHFRVALRMVRAAIAQLKEVFPQQDVINLKQRFDAIGRETNLLRDLDVFILDKDRYINLLPASLQQGLLPMFTNFEQDRTREVKRISRWLASRVYKNEIEELQSLFEHGYSALETEWSEKPTIELAVIKIQKRYKKIQKAAAEITSDTPDETIHSIRIDCKKLRYLLYFFGNLFNKKQVKIAGKHLKKLQNTLGVFNDLTVQGEFLEAYLDKVEHRAKKDVLLIASLGGLITSLHDLHIQERENCIRELAVFSNKQNRILFKNTFVVPVKS